MMMSISLISHTFFRFRLFFFCREIDNRHGKSTGPGPPQRGGRRQRNGRRPPDRGGGELVNWL